MIRPLANLYEQLRRLPGIGSKTAMRLAYHVIDMPAEDVKQLATALSGARSRFTTAAAALILLTAMYARFAVTARATALLSV